MGTDQFEALLPVEARNQTVRDEGYGLQAPRPELVELRRWGTDFRLQDYQSALISGVTSRALSEESARGMICLPTGAGKTITASFIVLSLMKRHADFKRCIWIAPQRELLHQAATACQNGWWTGAGPMSLDLIIPRALNVNTTTARHQILFVTPLIAEKLLARSGTYEIAVFDEAHHVAAPVFQRIWHNVTRHKNCKLGLGLSATPYRGEESELERLAESFRGNLYVPRALMPSPVKELISRKILSTPQFVLLEASRVSRAQWRKRKSLQSLVLAPERWDLLISYLRGVTCKTIVFCLSRAHGEAVTRHLRYIGVPAEYVDGDTSLPSRVAVFERFRDGDTKIIVNVGLFIEGVDCPAAEAAVVTYPVNSKNKLAQMIGRVLRGPEIGGTPHASVVAFEGNQSLVDVTLQLSPTQISFWNNIEQM